MMAPNLSTLVAQVAALNQAIVASAPLKDAPLAMLAPLILQAEATVSAIDAAIAMGDAVLGSGSVAGVSPGGFPPTLAAMLNTQSADMQNMVNLMALKGAIGRVLFNLQQAMG